jgi:dTDP-glucose 4,6-dehydratase/UDP-glucuronate decarboxylase
MLMTERELIQSDLEYLTRKAEDELRQLSAKRVWLTGGAGFLGYYLCKGIAFWNQKRRPADRIKLLVMDNFRRGAPRWLEEVKSQEIATLRHDVTEPIPDGLPSPDYVIHAASIASPTFYRQFPLETIDANVIGLRRFLDYAAATRGLAGMLFFSTSEIYGDPTPDAIPTKETFRGFVSSTGPRACYDESKRLGETLCVVFAQTKGVPVTMARPFNNYGPGLNLNDGRVLPDFARDVLNSRDIVMYSDGAPTRTFCYVTDALVGYLKILTRGRPGEPYNIGIEKPEISMRDLAHLVARHAQELWGYKGSVIHRASQERSYLEDNPNRRCPVIAKARQELDYAPEVDVDEGVRRALTWYYYNR